MEEKIILLKDEDWISVKCSSYLVIKFDLMGSSVKDGKVVAMNLTTPYASVDLECSELPNKKITGFIAHRIDFLNLWNVFMERGVKEDEEVQIIWTIEHYKLKATKMLHRIMPKIVVAIFKNGAYKLRTDNNYKPELTGMERYEAEKMIYMIEPDVIKLMGYLDK